jgi:DNA-binding transcriptional regulator YiaG
MNSALAFNPDRAGYRGALQRHSHQQPVNDVSKQLHLVSRSEPSLQHPENGADEGQMRSGTIRRTTRDQSDLVPSKADTRQAIKDALFRGLPAYKFTAGEIADRIGVSTATVEGWRASSGVPSAECVTMLRLAFPEFEAQLNVALGLSDLEPHMELIIVQLRQKLRSGQ